MKSPEENRKPVLKQVQSVFIHIATLTAAIFTFMVSSSMMAQAGTSSVTCTDVDKSNTCRIEGDGGFSQDFADLIADVMKAEKGKFETVCQKTNPDTPNNKAGYNVSCNLKSTSPDASLQIGCKEQGEGTGLSCELKNADPELLKIDCNRQGENGGKCSVSTSSAAAEKQLKNLSDKVSSVKLTPTQISFGGALLEACVSRTASEGLQKDCDRMLSKLSEVSKIENDDTKDTETKAKEIAEVTTNIEATLKAVIPLNFDLAIDLGKQAAYAQIKTLNNRLKDLRANKSSSNTANLQFFDGRHWLKTGDLLASASGTMNDSAPENALLADSRLGFFINGTLMDSEQESTDNEGATETTSQMLTLGIDYRFNSNFIGGFAFSYDTSDTDYSNNKGDFSSSGVNLMAYGSYFIDAWYIDATIMRGGTNHEQTRKLICDASCGITFDQTATAEYYGNTTGFTVSTGYDFNFNALSVTPFAQLNSTKITLDAYKETMSNPGGAGSAYGLDMKEQSRSMMTFSLGSQLRYAWAQNWGVIVPHLDLEFVKELDDDENVITGNFIGNTAKTKGFELTTNKLDSGYFFVGFGASAQLQNGSSGFINIRTLQGYQYLDQTIYSLGWRWEI